MRELISRLVAGLSLVAFLAPLVAGAERATLLVFPLENLTGVPSLSWVSEGTSATRIRLFATSCTRVTSVSVAPPWHTLSTASGVKPPTNTPHARNTRRSSASSKS